MSTSANETATLPPEEAATGGDPLLGKRIGVYRIVREIGRGGMGAVYEASRADREFEQRVAVKLIKRGMDADDIVRRFRTERQILAGLNHPHIARLLDGGTTEDGQPYFVLEFIEGEPLYRYCDARRLDLRGRLQLFTQICGAVEYAHEHRVIHRDLKPSNILVNQAGEAKLLDFGIARVLTSDEGAETATLTGLRMMTPNYASPEQMQGQPLGFPSDVYSLGVLLYELLTGRRPYHFGNRSLHEISRVICEDDPPPPSLAVRESKDILPITALGADTVSLETPARVRGASVEELSQLLAGGPDTITLKALRKDAGERFQSARELAEEIARWMEGRPLVTPDEFSTGEILTQKLAPAPSPAQVGNSLAVLPFTLLGISKRGADEDTGDEFLGIGLADSLITRLSKVSRVAVRPTSSVLRYNESSDPIEAGRKLGVAVVLDGFIRRAGARIRVSAQLMDVKAGATVWAEQFDEDFTDVLSLEDAISARVAEAILPQLTRDERQQLAKRGTDNFEAYEAFLRGRYCWNKFTPESFTQSLQHYQRAIQLDPNYAMAYVGIAIYYHWLSIYSLAPPAVCMPAAREAARKALELDDRLAEAFAALSLIALFYDYDLAEAERYEQRAMEMDPNNLQIRLWRSYRLMVAKRFEESFAEAQFAMELDQQTPLVWQQIGTSLFYARRFEESIAQYRAGLAANPLDGVLRLGLSYALCQQHRYDEAIAEIQTALGLVGDVPVFQVSLGAALAASGKTDEARAILRQLEAEACVRYIAPAHFALLHLALGEVDKSFEKFEEALAQRDTWLVLLEVEPFFDPLRGDPRYLDLVRRIGISTPPAGAD